MDIFGKNVSITVKDDDSYANTLGGITEQLAAAINDAGIPGLSAAKNDNASTITLTADVNVTNAKVNAGSQYISHTIGDNATVKVALSGAVKVIGSVTAASVTTGDAYAFTIMGHDVSFVVGTDGYADDKFGVVTQVPHRFCARQHIACAVTLIISHRVHVWNSPPKL